MRPKGNVFDSPQKGKKRALRKTAAMIAAKLALFCSLQTATSKTLIVKAGLA